MKFRFRFFDYTNTNALGGVYWQVRLPFLSSFHVGLCCQDFFAIAVAYLMSIRNR